MQPYSLPYKQQGAVLLIGMIMLVILMLGATSLMNSTVMDERLAGNSKASAEAFFAAEAGQLDAWNLLASDAEKSLGYKKWRDLYNDVEKLDKDDTEARVELFQRDVSTGSDYTVFAQYVRDTNGDIIPGRMKLSSRGTSNRGASRVIVKDLDGAPPSQKNPLAPAAISCFGARCDITAGSAKDKSLIDGRNHAIPDSDCSGQSCWLKPLGWDNEANEYSDPDSAISVPAAFLADRNGSDLNTGGQNNTPYIGQDYDFVTSEEVNPSSKIDFGGDNQAKSVWTEENFKNKNTPPPKYSDYFGSPAGKMMQSIYDDAQDQVNAGTERELGTVDNPKVTVLDAATTKQHLDVNKAGVLIIDGNGIAPGKGNKGPTFEKVTISGTGFYAGLVILRNCAQLETKGNFAIYGAVLVDSKTSKGQDCGDTYTPFSGNGHPDIKYSSDALNNTGFGGNGDGSSPSVANDWYEVIND